VRVAVAVLVAGLGVAAVEVVETAPEGSALDRPEIRNAITVLPALFDAAESTLDIAQMYMLYYPPESRGRLLYPLYDAIGRAGQRGVKVRILLDSLTLEQNRTETYCRMRERLAGMSGVEVRACDRREQSAYPGWMMHAKYCVVDRRSAFIGSHNWSFAGFADNRELSLLVEDTLISRAAAAVFETDWSGGRPAPGPAAGEPGPAEGLYASGPSRQEPAAALSIVGALEGITAGAESTLDVAVNSLTTRVDFGPAERFGRVESLLLSAAGRGVRVRLLVDRWAEEQDPKVLARLDSIAGIAVRVIDLSRAGPNPGTGSMHAKVVIADRRLALVGSATFSQRQLLECRNLAVVTGDAAAVAGLERVFETDWFATCTARPRGPNR